MIGKLKHEFLEDTASKSLEGIWVSVSYNLWQVIQENCETQKFPKNYEFFKNQS